MDENREVPKRIISTNPETGRTESQELKKTIVTVEDSSVLSIQLQIGETTRIQLSVSNKMESTKLKLLKSSQLKSGNIAEVKLDGDVLEIEAISSGKTEVSVLATNELFTTITGDPDIDEPLIVYINVI